MSQGFTGANTALTSGQIVVGSSANIGVAVTPSGDVTLSNTGVTTVEEIQGTSVSGTTGSGDVVFSNSPTLVTPALGTPSSGTLANCTGLPVAGGGTGQSSCTNGQLLIGNSTGNTLTKATLTAGTGISVTNGGGTITIANTSTGVIPFLTIGGLIISGTTGTHTTASFSISAGGCADLTGAAYIAVSSTLSWAASNGNAINGTDASSATLANSTTYHVFVCTGTSGTGSFVSASLTPTFPSGYNSYSRRIGSFTTTSAGAPIVVFHESPLTS